MASRRIVFIAILFCFSYVSFAQSNSFTYQIYGRCSAIKEGAKVHFRSQSAGALIKDSCIVKGGYFIFKGQIDEPKLVVLIMVIGNESINSRDRDLLTLFLDKKNVSLTVKDSIGKAVVKGSAEHMRYTQFNKLIEPIRKDYQKYNADKEVEKKDSVALVNLGKRYKMIQDKEADVIRSFVEKNSSSFVSVYAINSTGIGQFANPFIYENIFEALNKTIKESDQGIKLLTKIKNAQKQFTLVNMPDFKMTDTSGTVINLADYKGKYVLLDFWASWCTPCREQHPALKSIYQNFKDSGFEIIAVSLDKTKKDWVSAINKDGVPWVQISDLKGSDNEIAKYFGVSGIPYNFLLDKEGKIIDRYIEPGAMEKKLQELLK
jgi:peroxiredoxin